MIVSRGVGDITLKDPTFNPEDQGFLSQLVPIPMWMVLLIIGTIAHATWRMK